MTQRRLIRGGIGLGTGLILVLAGRSLADRVRPVSFAEEIRPILAKNCVLCHGGVRQQANLSLLFREDALKPAKSGHPAIIPGNPGSSELIRRITHTDPAERMPKGHPSLGGAEVGALRRWIAKGAPWEPHWAYVPPVAAPMPNVSQTAWPKDGLDRFVLARLEAERLTPSPEADCATLTRRASLDLIGLPPAAEETDRVCQAGDSNAYPALVDRLLASPRFGERWSAMWLDLARYADSRGYEADLYRTMWPYRDWVIKAFNTDVPFDRFTIEQLAGDLLPSPTNDQLVATAFHRNTMTNNEGGTDDEEHRVASVIDRVNTTWTVWQGTTMGCAQCHGHPYDPFRQEDYYRSFALFNNTADWDQPEEYPVHPDFPEAKRKAGHAAFGQLAALDRDEDSLAGQAELGPARRAWEARLSDPKVAGRIDGEWLAEVLRVSKLAEGDRSPSQRALMRLAFAAGSDDPRFVVIRRRRDQSTRTMNEQSPIMTPVLRELPSDRRRRTRLFERGNFLTPGPDVQPGVPASLGAGLDPNHADRLGLAQWLVSRNNPLTARVIVNRFWEQLFGTGLVETTEDFGTQGTPPSNQRLLDWLAVQFQDTDGWRVKALLRRIVLSATYRQSSRLTPVLAARDPDNRLLGRGPRFRLSAEQIRDQALFVSGLLSTTMYGPSVMPPQPEGVWHRPYSGEKWEPAAGDARYRRALYTLWKRTAPYPSLVAFDSPSREFCVSRRTRTNTPLQALVTMNDPAFFEAAQAVARRLLGRDPADPSPAAVDDYIDKAYRLALQRPPEPAVLNSLRDLYQKAAAHYAGHPADVMKLTGTTDDPGAAALTVVANAILNLDAVVTKD